MCCRLSRCVCSLSSAGNVCWAKPNHAFFNCQQPVDVFFQSRSSSHRQTCASMQREDPSTLASRNHATSRSHVKREHWRGLQRRMHARVECRMQLPTHHDAWQAHALRMHRTVCARFDAMMRLRVAQVGLRGNCANFFRRAKHSGFDFACMHRREKENPRRCRRGSMRCQPRPDDDQWSSSSSSSAYSSGPSRSLSWSASSIAMVNNQPSP